MTDLAKDSDYIVLDLETTGLDSEQDLILSTVGSVTSPGANELGVGQAYLSQ